VTKKAKVPAGKAPFPARIQRARMDRPLVWLCMGCLVSGLFMFHAGLSLGAETSSVIDSDQFELVGLIEGRSGYAGGRGDVAVLKKKGSTQTVVVSKGAAIPGSGGVVFERVQDGKVILRSGSGALMALNRDPFPSAKGQGSSAEIADADTDWMEDGTSYDESVAAVGDMDEAILRSYDGPETLAPRVDPVMPPEPQEITKHYSIPRGEEADFLEQKAAIEQTLVESSGSGNSAEVGETVGKNSNGEDPNHSLLPPELVDRVQRSPDTYGNRGVYERFRRYKMGQNEGAGERPPVMRQ
jgi:hypothetical protein